MRWAYGVTTCKIRKDAGILQKTLDSLKGGGFPLPRLFVDGITLQEGSIWEEYFGLEVTVRNPKVKTAGNWILTLWELYLRQPDAERYAVFQDDFLTYKNLRTYLDNCPYPEKGYWNLYTFPSNQDLCPMVGKTGREYVGWYEANQFGRGAVALIFSRAAVTTLLSSSHLVERPQDMNRGWRSIDGGVVTAFKKAGWKEFVHNPSLVYHTGEVSSMGNVKQKQTRSFRGESFDALNLLEERKHN